MMFGVAGPGYRNPIKNMAFNLYAMEIEERKEKINNLISYFCDSHDPNNPFVQVAAFNFVGLQPTDLTLDEVEYIEREVSRRWCHTQLLSTRRTT